MKPLECSRLNAKNRVQAGEENLVVNSVKSGRKIPPPQKKKKKEKKKKKKKEEQKCCYCPERKEYRLQYVTIWSHCCILLDRLTERDC